MADIKVVDNRIQCKNAMNDACVAFLYEASAEFTSQTQRNMPPGQWFAQQKGAWKSVVDEGKLEAVVGNPMQQAIWTEFGTGEYALHKDGRKGYWVYVKDSDGSFTSTGGKYYTLQDAKQIVAMMRADGLDAHYTKGQTPKRPLWNAFESLKGTIQKMAEQILKDTFQ